MSMSEETILKILDEIQMDKEGVTTNE